MVGKSVLLLFVAACTLTNIKFGGHFYLTHYIVLAMTAVLAIKQLWRGDMSFPTYLLLWTWLILIASVISFYSAMDFSAFRYMIPLLIFYLTVFLCCWAIRGWEDVKGFVTATLWGCGIQAAVGFYQSVDWILRNGFVFIANGKFWRPYGLNVSGSDYVAQLGIGLYLSLLVEKPAIRRTLVAFFVFQLLTSMSRTGMVMIFLAAATSLLFMSWKTIRNTLIIPACVGLAILLATTGTKNPVFQRIGDIGNINYNIKRFVTYDDVLTKVQATDLGFMFGNGFGTYTFFHPIDQAVYDNPHNIFLHLLYSMGAFGLTVFLCGMGSLIWCAIRLKRQAEPDSYLGRLMQAILLIHASVWITGLVDSNIVGLGQGWLLGFIFGIPLAIGKFGYSAGRSEAFPPSGPALEAT